MATHPCSTVRSDSSFLQIQDRKEQMVLPEVAILGERIATVVCYL